MGEMTDDLLEYCSCNILFVPLGDINAKELEKYFQTFSKISTFSISDLTLNFAHQSIHNLIIDCYSDGKNDSKMYAKYFQRSMFEDGKKLGFQSVQAVIGVIHCPSTESVAREYENYLKFLEEFQLGNVVKRCFAFEPDESELDQENDIIVVPNQGNLLDFYVQTLLSDLMSEVIGESLKQIKLIESEFAVSPIDKKDVSHHEKFGRNNKIIGDLYLLIGSLPEAISCYISASAYCKSASEYLCLANATEKLYLSLYLKELHAGTKNAEEMFQLYPEKYSEILNLYAKSNSYTETMAAYFRAASILFKLGQKSEMGILLNNLWSIYENLDFTQKVFFFIILAEFFV